MVCITHNIVPTPRPPVPSPGSTGILHRPQQGVPEPCTSTALPASCGSQRTQTPILAAHQHPPPLSRRAGGRCGTDPTPEATLDPQPGDHPLSHPGPPPSVSPPRSVPPELRALRSGGSDGPAMAPQQPSAGQYLRSDSGGSATRMLGEGPGADPGGLRERRRRCGPLWGSVAVMAILALQIASTTGLFVYFTMAISKVSAARGPEGGWARAAPRERPEPRLRSGQLLAWDGARRWGTGLLRGSRCAQGEPLSWAAGLGGAAPCPR